MPKSESIWPRYYWKTRILYARTLTLRGAMSCRFPDGLDKSANAQWPLLRAMTGDLFQMTHRL